MPSIDTSIGINASATEVWRRLGDLEAIGQYGPFVKSAVVTTDTGTGVGAARSCDLGYMGTATETVIGWEPNRRLQLTAHNPRVPVERGALEFRIDGDEAPVTVWLTYEWEPRPGLLGRAAMAVAQPKLASMLNRMLGGLKDDVEARAA